MKITADQVDSFFRERGANDACPVCSKTEWGLSPAADQFTNEIEAAELHLPLFSERMMATNSLMPLLPLVCSHCGFVRMHHTFPILQWLKDQSNSEG